MRTILYYLFTSGYDNEEKVRRLDLIKPLLPDDYRIIFTNANEAPEYLDKTKEITSAINTSIKWIPSLTPENCDAVITGVALDPGLPLLRKKSRIPLVGPGEASLFIASLLGLPTSILVAENQIEAGWQFVDQTVSKPEIVSIRSIGVTVRTIISDFERGRAALMNAAKDAIYQDDAQALYLGSMTFATLGILSNLQGTLNIPIYDPLRIALRATIALVESTRINGNKKDKLS